LVDGPIDTAEGILAEALVDDEARPDGLALLEPDDLDRRTDGRRRAVTGGGS
jgi:hypothetical protein